jgi:hypothetical protein
MTKPRLLDLFCGAGGAGRGYQMAGFHVTGVDIKPQPRYAGDVFIQGDALEYAAAHGHEYDAIHASPPCQFASRTNPASRVNHKNMIPATRDLLLKIGRPYVIENVEDARRHLIAPLKLCGTMFGLPIFRHRYFEYVPNFIRIEYGERLYCQHIKDPILVTGTPRRKWQARRQDATIAEKRAAMQIDWMVTREMDEAIPPAYTHYIGTQLMRYLMALKGKAS